MDTIIGKEECLDMAVKLIKEGEVVAFPTETVYGLGGDAFNESSIDRIYIAKGRPRDNPLIVHVSCVEEIEKVAYLNEQAKILFEKFSPGPITIVLPKKAEIPECVTAGLQTVGVRIPKSKLARDFISKSGTAIAAPSANKTKRISPTSAEAVYEDMKGRISLILDGGECEVGIESTVITLAGEIPTILRPGAITKEMLVEYLPKVKNFTGEILIAEAPGMKYKHYAPLVDCFMYKDIESAIKNYSDKTVILCKEEFCERLKGYNFVNLGKSGEEIAHNIFRVMRECEKCFDCILLPQLSEEGIEGSIMNRISKSCEYRMVE